MAAFTFWQFGNYKLLLMLYECCCKWIRHKERETGVFYKHFAKVAFTFKSFKCTIAKFTVSTMLTGVHYSSHIKKLIQYPLTCHAWSYNLLSSLFRHRFNSAAMLSRCLSMTGAHRVDLHVVLPVWLALKRKIAEHAAIVIVDKRVLYALFTANISCKRQTQ